MQEDSHDARSPSQGERRDLQSEPTVEFTPGGGAQQTEGRSSPAAGATLGRFGDYELIDEIGRGGVGVVYRARQVKLDRMVALKMLLASHWASRDEVSRFQVEARVAAGLAHPNLVKVFDVGEAQGLHYFVMEYVVGRSLEDLLASGKPDFEDAARLLCRVSRAVDYLHRNGIVHRDLKPSNILIDDAGQPYVTDFGLAKIVGGGDLTQPGSIVGTPCYMSPEQATGHVDAICSRSDVYSLGAILYELLTGQSPFRSGSPMDTLVQVVEREPVRPRKLNPAVPWDLEQICLKCLEKAPESRYTGAEDLAVDLDRFLTGEPVEARPAGIVQVTLRWARRCPALACRLGGMSLFYVVELLNYHVFGLIPTLKLHLQLTGILVVWAVSSWIFQRLLERGGASATRATFLWGLMDVACVTWILLLLDGVVSSLIVVYPLLVVGSGLWFLARFVAFVTAASVLSYGLLIADYHLLRPDRYPAGHEVFWDRHVFFVLMLLLAGSVVSYQVRRVQALSRYYRTRRI